MVSFLVKKMITLLIGLWLIIFLVVLSLFKIWFYFCHIYWLVIAQWLQFCVIFPFHQKNFIFIPNQCYNLDETRGYIFT